MSAPTAWALPTVAVLNGRQYSINTDYRDILEILAWLNGDEGGELSQEERCYVALRLFYRDFGAIPRQDWQEAAEFLSVFLSGGRPDRAAPGPRLLDWRQDAPLIAAGVNKAAGREIRAMRYLHWWTFLSYFEAIGEGTLSTVVGIRDKLRRGKKLEGWELEFYRTHRAEVDLRPRLTPEEAAARAELQRLLA